MSELSKQALKVDNNQSFPNNSTGYITPAILRTFNDNVIDSVVVEETYQPFTQSVLQSLDALDAFTASLNVSFDALDAFTASAQISINALNATTQSVNASITQLNAFTASQSSINGGYNTFTQSVAVSIGKLNDATASLQSFTASATISITALNASTASQQISINALNAYTSSTNSDLASIHATTASLQSQLATIGTQSGSWGGGGGSGSVPNGTVSSSAQITAFGFVSGSYETTGRSIVSSSAQITALGFISSSTAIPAGTISGSTQIIALGFQQTSSFNTYTSSVNSSISALNTTTASINSSITQLNASSASQQVSINALNAATSSYVTSAQTASMSVASASVALKVSASISSQNLQHFVTFTDNSTGTQAIYVDGGLKYNPNQDLLLTSNITASGYISASSLNLTGALTASLATGYVWVGNGGNKTTLVSTSSFAGGTINTGSFATTGSNTFNGQQNVYGNVNVLGGNSLNIAANAELSGSPYSNMNVYVDDSTDPANVYSSIQFINSFGNGIGGVAVNSYSSQYGGSPVFMLVGGGNYSGSDVSFGFLDGRIDVQKPTSFKAPIEVSSSLNINSSSYNGQVINNITPVSSSKTPVQNIVTLSASEYAGITPIASTLYIVI